MVDANKYQSCFKHIFKLVDVAFVVIPNGVTFVNKNANFLQIGQSMIFYLLVDYL